MMAGAGGIRRQTTLGRVIGGLFVPALRVAVAAFQLSKLAERVEPPGKQRPHREGPGELHGLIEVSITVRVSHSVRVRLLYASGAVFTEVTVSDGAEETRPVCTSVI